MAIHSESQRMIREADANLPYHEPKQFSKFSEFKAMLEAEMEEESILKQPVFKPKKVKPKPSAPPPVPDLPSKDLEVGENLEAQKTATAEWVDSLPSKPPSPSGDLASMPCCSSDLPDEGIEQEVLSLPSRPPSPPVVLTASTPFHPKKCEALRNKDLPLPEVNFDVDLDSQSSIHGSSDVDMKRDNEDEPSPLVQRLMQNSKIATKRLVSALRNVNLENMKPKLGSPNSSGFIELGPTKGKKEDHDASIDSTGSTHPILRRLRRHMQPTKRTAKCKANQSIEIITRQDEGNGEKLKLEEIRLMPPPPVPERYVSAGCRAAKWKEHRAQLKEEMRLKRLQGLEERQRRWAMYHDEDIGETKKVRSADDMDSDDEEYLPGEESEGEEVTEDEEEEEEDNADDEEEEEEDEVEKKGVRSEFLDEEAEEDAEEDEEDDLKFGETLPDSPVELRLCEEDDNTVLVGDQPSSKTTSEYSRKLSLTSTTRDLFASDPDEISSVRSSVSSIFQPGQRSYMLPDDSSTHSASSHNRVSDIGASEFYPNAETSNQDNTVVWNAQESHISETADNDITPDSEGKNGSLSQDPSPDSPIKMGIQTARALFNHNSEEDGLEKIVGDLFMADIQGDAPSSDFSTQDVFDSGYTQKNDSRRSSISERIEQTEEESDEEVGIVGKRKRARKIIDSSDEEEKDDVGGSGEESEEEEEESELEEEPEEQSELEEESEAEMEATRDGEVDEDDEMAMLKAIELQTNRKERPKASDFLEQEAELSGSDGEVSSDENEHGLDGDDEDNDWIAKDNADVPSDVHLRRQVERVHARMERDDDQRAVRYLQEIYLPDGDLTPGDSLRRRFRWRGLEDREDEEGEMGPYIESDNESEEENQVSFVDDQGPMVMQAAAKTGEENLNTSVTSGDANVTVQEEEESQLLRRGLNALTKVRQVDSGDQEETQTDSVSKPRGLGLVKRGSFLSKATSDLGRIRDILRQSDSASGRNKGGMAVFSMTAAGNEKSGKKQASGTKRPSTEGYESGKKLCISGKPLSTVNSIFNSIDRK